MVWGRADAVMLAPSLTLFLSNLSCLQILFRISVHIISSFASSLGQGILSLTCTVPVAPNWSFRALVHYRYSAARRLRVASALYPSGTTHPHPPFRTGLLDVSQTSRAHRRAFVLTVPSPWNALLPGVCRTWPWKSSKKDLLP